MIEDQHPTKETQFTTYANSFALTLQDFEQMLLEDGLYSMVAMFFVFTYFWISLRSLWMATIGITMILFSFPFTVCITNLIFQVKYFGSL